MSRLRQFRRKVEKKLRRRAVAKAFTDPSRDIVHLEFDHISIGMFAQLSYCVKIAQLAERHGKRPVMRLLSANYRDTPQSPEWFGTYFVNKAAGDLADDLRPTRFLFRDELPKIGLIETLEETAELFARHYGIAPDIEAQVAALAQELSIGPQTLTLHYRGTDKFVEAPLQEAEDVLERVARYADSQQGVENIFVSSDEAAFVERALKGVGGRRVVALEDSVRSDNGQALHLPGFREGNSAMGRDAVLNALMLSRGGWLCRTASFLSAWSVLFNPSIKVALLSVPHEETTWQFEKLILKRAKRI